MDRWQEWVSILNGAREFALRGHRKVSATGKFYG
jgi:hypothetical protein